MMKNRWTTILLATALVGSVSAYGAKLKNASFEDELGARGEGHAWGDKGEQWGEAYRVPAESNSDVRQAKSGEWVLLINLPQETWSGVWQELPWEPNADFTFKGHYLITGDDLPDDCETLLKVEFYDEQGNQLGEREGEHLTEQTKGKWKSARLSGTTPEHTASIRFVVVGGKNRMGPDRLNRVYWDDLGVK